MAVAIAHDSGSSLSATIGRLLRVALAAPGPVRVSTSATTGLQVASIGSVVTSQDVQALDDDE